MKPKPGAPSIIGNAPTTGKIAQAPVVSRNPCRRLRCGASAPAQATAIPAPATMVRTAASANPSALMLAS